MTDSAVSDQILFHPLKKIEIIVTGARSRVGFVEAAVENLEIKQRIFADLEQACRPDCVLSTNTSTSTTVNATRQ